MSRLNDIATLLRAGFTVAQIAELEKQQGQQPAPAPAQDPAPAPAQDPAPAPAPAPAQDPAPAPAQQPAPAPAFDPNEMAAIISQAVVSGIQSANILGSNQPKEQTIDDIYASIIDPDYKKED